MYSEQLYVVATMIYPEGESDALFLEPADHIDEGCVALTEPMYEDEAIAALDEMQAQRRIDNPSRHHWYTCQWLPPYGGGT